jgi:hypothetical protein
MAGCINIHGDSPGEGPGYLSAEVAKTDVNEDNPTWKVTMDHSPNWTIYKSEVATTEQLEEAFAPQFEAYHIVHC